ncbi:MAG: glutamate--tRNA ligase [Phycisphaerae bacterium]|nr:glutamate--tRNA ligase [Phycisphaerae bacterium]
MTTNAQVRCRFAPSPTGYLHVGGARTALFNYLLAKRAGGTFILRIEDTDQTRNVRDAERQLLEDLRWLGLQWDEGPEAGGACGPYRQSEKLERYRAQARQLIDEGKAYYSFDTREELEAMRKAAEAAKRTFIYPRPKSFPSHADAQKARDAGRPVVVRLAMPERDITVSDTILGEVTIRAADLTDFVLLKPDGWPTYHFAVVVDDYDMKITHVLRGQEHLMNTPNHVALQWAFGYPTPVYGHLPIILNMSGSKMGKRDKDKAVRDAALAALKSGKVDDNALCQIADCPEFDQYLSWKEAQSQLTSEQLQRLGVALGIVLPEVQVHDFRQSGYLPEVLCNFLALLGWSPGDSREKFSMEELAAAFSIERINKANARFDRDKLLNFNLDGIAKATPERLLAAMRSYLEVSPASPFRGQSDETILNVLKLSAGVRTLREVETKAGALFVDDAAIRYDAAAVEKFLIKDAGAMGVLREVRKLLAELPTWETAALDAAVRAFVDEKKLKLAAVAQPLRIALTGGTISPAIFETLALIGREKTLRRIDRCLVSVGGAAIA